MGPRGATVHETARRHEDQPRSFKTARSARRNTPSKQTLRIILRGTLVGAQFAHNSPRKPNSSGELRRRSPTRIRAPSPTDFCYEFVFGQHVACAPLADQPQPPAGLARLASAYYQHDRCGQVRWRVILPRRRPEFDVHRGYLAAPADLGRLPHIPRPDGGTKCNMFFPARRYIDLGRKSRRVCRPCWTVCVHAGPMTGPSCQPLPSRQ